MRIFLVTYQPKHNSIITDLIKADSEGEAYSHVINNQHPYAVIAAKDVTSTLLVWTDEIKEEMKK